MKERIKTAVRWFFLVFAFPIYWIYLFLCIPFGKEKALRPFTQLSALCPGLIGSFLRVGFYRLALRQCAPSCHIEFLTTLVTPDISIGKNVYIGGNCNLSRCELGDDCLVGSHVLIMSGKSQHVFDDPCTPIRLQGGKKEVVRIGRDCWLGNGSLIMADVGEGSVVAAGSVVTKPVPPYTIVAGNPAKVLGKRQ